MAKRRVSPEMQEQIFHLFYKEGRLGESEARIPPRRYAEGFARRDRAGSYVQSFLALF